MKSGNYFELSAPKIYLLAQHPPKNDKTSFKFFFEQGYCVTCGLFDFGIYFVFSSSSSFRWRPAALEAIPIPS